jgi:tetratricopeptide (TPR) repeat protein
VPQLLKRAPTVIVKSWLGVRRVPAIAEIERLLQIPSGDPWPGVANDELDMAFLTQATRTVATPELLEKIKSMADTAAASPPWFPGVTGAATTALGFVAIASQDKQAATELYDSILPRKGLVDPFLLCSNDDVLGLLAKTAGRIDVAETHFKEAVKFCRSAGYRPELAWTCSDYAEMLLDRDEPGDREKAIELQDEALVITQELGMRPLTERILARREILRA